MTKKSRIAGMVLVAVFTRVAVIGASASESRPFGATLKGQSNVTPTADPCLISIAEAGAGTAVHMGTIAWASSETLNVCSNPEGADAQAEFVITAPNGDEAFGRYVTVVHADFAAGVFTFAGTWEIVGGTGRFQHARGEGTLSGDGTLGESPTVRGHLIGRISY